MVVLVGCQSQDRSPHKTPNNTVVADTGSSTDGEVVCPEPAPVPTCQRPDQSTPGTTTPGTVPCTSHSDCTDSEFCGGGYCRDASEGYVTACLVQGWLQGNPHSQDGSAPDLRASLHHIDGQVQTMMDTQALESCQPLWNECESWLLHDTFSLGMTERVNGGSEFVLSRFVNAISLARMVDQSCVPIEDQDNGYPDGEVDFEARLWVSVWYP